jgi:hypothetical protein
VKPPNPHPKVIHLRSARITPERHQAQEERIREAQQEAKVRNETRLATKEYRGPELHHYDAARNEMNSLAFAEHVLKCEGQLYQHHGYPFIDGKYATPAMKVEVASAILKRLKLAPIVLGRRT